jgi:integrase/recombinase XerD
MSGRIIVDYSRHLQRRGLSPSTVELYLATVRRLLRHLGVRALRQVRRRHLEQYLAQRSGVLSPSTSMDELYRLRGFFKAMVSLGNLPTSPADGLEAKQSPYGMPLLLSEDAVGALLTAALVVPRSSTGGRPAALRTRALLELAYACGLRASELSALQTMNLSTTESTIIVHRAKRGGQALLPLPPSCLEHLRAYLREGRPVLVQRGRHRDRGHLLLTDIGTPMDRRRIAELVARVAQRARRRAHPHAFRRALASHLIRNGAAVTVVQDLLGHRRLDTTARYIEVDREDLRRAVEILDRPGPGGARR